MPVREVVASFYRGAIPVLLVSAVGGLVAGSILSGMEADLQKLPGVLVLVPAFLAIRGSVYGSLGSRLSSGLHQGLVAPAFVPDRRVATAVVAAVLNGLTASVFAAVLTYAGLSVFGLPVAPLGALVIVAIVGGLLAGVALTTVVLTVVFWGYRRGMNPDDLVGPAVTTAGDVFGMASLFLATRLAIWIV